MNKQRSTKGALSDYVHYFQAEQEGRNPQNHLHAAKERTADEETLMIGTLLEGRKLVHKPGVTSKEVETWVSQAEKSLDDGPMAYAYFLAGTAFSNIASLEKADLYLSKCGKAFLALKAPDRELLSHIQRPTLSRDNLFYLRKWAEQTQDSKSFHAANYSLARSFFHDEEYALSMRYCRQALNGFREDFLDPSRIKLGRQLLYKIKSRRLLKKITREFSPNEKLLLGLLQDGAKTKLQLMESLYGLNFHLMESVDSRFRTLLSRLNAKLESKIIRLGDRYALNCNSL